MADPRTLILRFADPGKPTIDLHEAILAREGEVWWGWWRKAHEEQRLDVLVPLAEKVPLTIGLVERRAGRFYRARCDAIALAGEDAVIGSPECSHTPAYYNEEEFPAWFRLAEIKEVDLQEWNTLFNDFGEPTGDDTLYPIDDTAELVDSGSAVPRYEAGTPGELVLHLSDLHFGADHGFDLDGRLESHSMRERVMEGVETLQEQVGVLVVSGDITTEGDVHHMQVTALEQIKALAEELSLPLDNVIVIPGNHDIRLMEAKLGDYKHERGFRTFLDELFGEGRREPDALFTFETPRGRTLNFATLNSVRLSGKDTRMYGYVGPRSKFVFDALTERHGARDTVELARDGVFNFVVLHHHLVSGALINDPPPQGPISLTLDAGRIIAEAQAASVHVAIHGHEHLPFIGSAARQEPLEQDNWDGYKRPLAVIGGGSAGARFQRLPARMRDNTYGIYRPVDGGLEVEVYRFNHELKPHQLLQTALDFVGDP